MKHSEQDQQNLQLYLSYPLRHFQLYSKVTHPNKYKPSTYEDMSISLNALIQIFIQYALLLLQSAQKQRILGIAAFPGYLNKQRLHFYAFDTKGQKGFVNINYGQIIAELTKFINALKLVKLEDRQEFKRMDDFKEFIESMRKCLIQCEKSWYKLNSKSPTQEIIRFIERLNANQIVVKYHNLSQIKSAFIFPKTVKDSIYTQKYYSLQASKIFANYSLTRLTEQLLSDLQTTSIINSIQKIKSIQKDIQESKLPPFTIYTFYVDLFGNVFQKDEKSILRKKYPHKQMRIQLKNGSLTPNVIDFTSFSYWQISKQQYVQIDTFWLKLKLQINNIANSLGIEQPINLSSLFMELGQENRLILRNRLKYQSLMGAKLICLIDIHMLIHWAINPFLQACHFKLKQMWFNPQDLCLTEDRLNFTKLIMQKWLRYLHSIFSTVLLQYKIKPFTL